jgi:hypothetical protein
MTTDLYDTDGVAWSEQQADLLRRLAPTQACQWRARGRSRNC